MKAEVEPGDKTTRARRSARNEGSRSLVVLVCAFLIMFVAAIIVQIEARGRWALQQEVERQTVLAAIISERVGANVAAAWGANAAAAEAIRTPGVDARFALRLAMRAHGARAAALVSSDGEIIAATRNDLSAAFRSAARAAARQDVWAGVVAAPNGAHAPALARSVNGRIIVSVLEPSRLAPTLAADTSFALASSNGHTLFASATIVEARLDLPAAFANARGGRSGRAVSDERGGRWAAGTARTPIADMIVYVAAPRANPLATWLQSAAYFALIAAAPFAAIAILLLLVRQSAARVQLAEAQAERAEAQFRLAADGAHAGVFEWRTDSETVQLSGAAMRLLGATADTLHITQWIALAAEPDRATLHDDIRNALQSGVLDARFRVGHGPSHAWIEARGTMIEDEAGVNAARVIGTIIDVTTRRQAQIQATRLERQLQVAIDSYSGPFALWDKARRLVTWNKTYGEVFGLGPELLRPRASYAAVAAAAKARIRHEPVNVAEPDIRTIELMSGEWLQLVERRTSDGGLVTVGVDITALKRKEEELARNEKRLSEALQRAEQQEYEIKALIEEANLARRIAEEANDAKSSFLANMSHELRTPLNAIIGFSEMMSKELLGSIGVPQYRGYARDIHAAGSHLLLLINDILDMAKIEAGKYTLQPMMISVVEEIEQALSMNKPAADKKNLPIVIDAPNLPEIEADPRAVTQMISNLLSNAVKFTEKGMVLVNARAVENGVVIRVVDSGLGIPTEHLKDLATPFKQVETELSRTHQGSGLGLALTKTLAELHGGRMHIHSEVGKGTIVTIALPLQFGAGPVRIDDAIAKPAEVLRAPPKRKSA